MKFEKAKSVETDYLPRPTVIFIGDFEGTQEPLIKVLEEDYNVQPLIIPSVYERGGENVTEKLNRLIKAGFVSCIVIEHCYDERMLAEELDSLESVRSKSPIFIKYSAGADRLNETFLSEHTSVVLSGQESYAILKGLIQQWKPPANYFGVRDINELSQISSMLADIGTMVHAETDYSVPVDPNNALTTQALRMGLAPIETRYADMESYGNYSLQNFHVPEGVRQEILSADIAKFRLLSDVERASVIKEIYLKLGWEIEGDGGVRVVSASRGSKTLGFALDLDTGFHSTSSGYGSHAEAKTNVVRLIQEELLYRALLSGTNQNSDAEWGIELKIHHGLIVPVIKGFASPFAMIWGELDDLETRKKVADFIKTTHIAIPIDPSGELVE